jgi:hypothetical protein
MRRPTRHDPAARSLTVYRWTAKGHPVELTAAGDDAVRPAPFDALEVRAADLLVEEDE